MKILQTFLFSFLFVTTTHLFASENPIFIIKNGQEFGPFVQMDKNIYIHLTGDTQAFTEQEIHSYAIQTCQQAHQAYKKTPYAICIILHFNAKDLRVTAHRFIKRPISEETTA